MNNIDFSNNNFLESKFITNVNNIFIQLNLSIMENNLSKIDHFVDDNIFSELKSKLDDLNAKNQIQIFEEINIKQTLILKITNLEDKDIIKVNITSEYVSYVINKDNKTIISGNPDRLIEKENYLTFEKQKDANIQGEARKCHSCGSNMDINDNGKCQYCGAIYNLENYDWVLIDLKTL